MVYPLAGFGKTEQLKEGVDYSLKTDKKAGMAVSGAGFTEEDFKAGRLPRVDDTGRFVKQADGTIQPEAYVGLAVQEQDGGTIKAEEYVDPILQACQHSIELAAERERIEELAALRKQAEDNQKIIGEMKSKIDWFSKLAIRLGSKSDFDEQYAQLEKSLYGHTPPTRLEVLNEQLRRLSPDNPSRVAVLREFRAEQERHWAGIEKEKEKLASTDYCPF